MSVIEDREFSDGARQRDRELTAGICFTKENVCERIAPFLTKVPSLEQRVGFLRKTRHGQWTAVEQQGNERLSCRDHRLDQRVLIAEETECAAIAGQHTGDRLASDGGVVTHDQQYNVGTLRHSHRLIYTRLV